MKRRSIFVIRAGAVLGMSLATTMAVRAQAPGSPVPANVREYVFVGSGGPTGELGHVTTYALDRVTGRLTQVDREQIGGALVSFLAVNPRKAVVYATDPRTRKVHWLMVDPRTGMLTANASWSQAASGGPEHIVTDNTGSTLVTANFGQGTADVFPLDPNTGAIMPRTDSIATGRNPHFAEFSLDNRYAYIGTQVDHYVSQFAYRDGRLVPLTPATVARMAPRQFGFHPTLPIAYTVSGPTDNVGIHRVAPDGTLTPVDSVRRMPGDYTGNLNSTGGTPNITPDGRFLYVNNRGSNTIAIYSINQTTGIPTLIGQEPTRGLVPRHADMDPSGEFYIVGNVDSKTIIVYRINPATGALTFMTSTDAGVSPYAIAIRRLPAN